MNNPAKMFPFGHLSGAKMNAQAGLGPVNEAKLRSMITNHKHGSSQVSTNERVELNRLAVSVKKRLFAGPIPADILSWTVQCLTRTIPSLTPMEVRSLAVYVLHQIAAAGGDSREALITATKQTQETQMSFNLQYLQLQHQMQSENRSYTAVSNIMKTKHDTVKNSISNVR